MKPKLLVCTSTFPRWRNDTDPPFVYELSKRLTDTFEVIVHAPHFPGAKTKEEMEGMWVHRFRYFFSPLEKLAGATGILPTLRHNKLYYGIVPFFLFFQFLTLLFLVKKTRPDVIHAHWIIPQGFIAVLVGKMTKIDVVITAHGADIFGLQTPLLLAIKRFTLKHAKAVTVVSNALSKAVNHLLPTMQSPEIVPMGVSSKNFSQQQRDNSLRLKHNISEDDLLLLFVGRLTKKKGVKYLIEAMPLVLKNIPSAKLLIVGRGEAEYELKSLANKLKIGDHIQFVGSLHNTELPEYYASADIFIGPSIRTPDGDTEGFGLTFVEAAMSGCLLIGTDVGGIGDIIKHKQTGYIVPEKDSHALAKYVIYANHNKDIAEKLIANALIHCKKRFDWQSIAKKYEEILIKNVIC